MEIVQINDEIQKQNIARLVLKDLPEWFGIEESTEEYIRNVVNYPFLVAFDNDLPIGFYSLREENENILDMYVLGVLKKYHNQGIGSQLQKAAEDFARSNHYQYLMVLTLAKKVQNKEYLLTREFYLKQGFIDFYQNDAIFDQHNPCQIMLKQL